MLPELDVYHTDPAQHLIREGYKIQMIYLDGETVE